MNAWYIPQNSLYKFWMPSLDGFDIWHCTYQNSDYVPHRERKIKVVLTIHDLNFIYQNKPELRKAVNLKHLQRNIDRSDAIVCVSEFTRNDVLRYCDVKSKPLVVIHNGTNSLYDPMLETSSYMPKKPFLFSLGTFHRKKNFHVLLSLLRHNKYLELLIAGRPDDIHYITEINRIALQLGVSKNLHMLFNITEGEKSWYYHNCYSFLLPSISEGFGLTVPEAMSVGKPVFLSGSTSLPEIGGKHAFYFKNFESGQMQSDFVQGMKRYKKFSMQENIKDHSRSFSWDKAARAYIKVYESLAIQ
jgi:glycosyltransferase involved in cell wall biosynthesis